MADEFWSDVRFSLRALRRSPAFAGLALVTLGLGINVAMFTLVNSVLLAPLPYPEPERLVRLWSHWAAYPRGSVSGPEYLDYIEQNQVFSSLALYHTRSVNANASNGQPQRLVESLVTGQFFAVMGIPAIEGRTLAPADDLPGRNRVAVLSHGFWTRHMGGDPEALGKTIRIENQPNTVIGVMPAGFAFPGRAVDLWTPIGLDPANPGNRGSHRYQAIARLKPQIPLDRAQSEMSAIAARLQEHYPESYPNDSGWDIFLLGLHDLEVESVRAGLWVLQGAVVLVLLIACANMANLLLARSTRRQREMAIRCALGAGRRRLIRQLLVESALLAIMGSAAGLAFATAILRLLPVLSPSFPRLDEVSVDAWTVLFCLLLARATAAQLQFNLQEAGRGPSGGCSVRTVGLARNLGSRAGPGSAHGCGLARAKLPPPSG